MQVGIVVEGRLRVLSDDPKGMFYCMDGAIQEHRHRLARRLIQSSPHAIASRHPFPDATACIGFTPVAG